MGCDLLIQAVVETNAARTPVIAEEILKAAAEAGADTVGVYRLTMKQGSDNMRSSAMHDVVKLPGEVFLCDQAGASSSCTQAPRAPSARVFR